MTDDIIEFLKESNRIENVTDSDSLQQAIYAWEYLIEEAKLDTGVLLKTHKILMLHQPLPPNQRGYFRDHDVVLTRRMEVPSLVRFDETVFRTTVIKKFPPYQDVRKLLDTWLAVANKVTTAEFPVEWCKQSHIQFENIHPFADGNGRVGRMLLNWQRLAVGEPILIIKYSERDSYYKWFKSSEK